MFLAPAIIGEEGISRAIYAPSYFLVWSAQAEKLQLGLRIRQYLRLRPAIQRLASRRDSYEPEQDLGQTARRSWNSKFGGGGQQGLLVKTETASEKKAAR